MLVSKHTNINENDIANELAKQDDEKHFSIRPEPFFEGSNRQLKKEFKTGKHKK